MKRIIKHYIEISSEDLQANCWVCAELDTRHPGKDCICILHLIYP